MGNTNTTKRKERKRHAPVRRKSTQRAKRKEVTLVDDTRPAAAKQARSQLEVEEKNAQVEHGCHETTPKVQTHEPINTQIETAMSAEEPQTPKYLLLSNDKLELDWDTTRDFLTPRAFSVLNEKENVSPSHLVFERPLPLCFASSDLFSRTFCDTLTEEVMRAHTCPEFSSRGRLDISGFHLHATPCIHLLHNVVEHVIFPPLKRAVPALCSLRLKTAYVLRYQAGMHIDRYTTDVFGSLSAVEHPVHIDSSDLTLSLCLSDGFTGGSLKLKIPRAWASLSDHKEQYIEYEYPHQYGTAMLHPGNISHCTAPVTDGQRMQLIVWMEAKTDTPFSIFSNEQLTPELKAFITSYLPPKDLASFEQASKSCKKVVDDAYLWKQLFHQTFYFLEETELARAAGTAKQAPADETQSLYWKILFQEGLKALERAVHESKCASLQLRRIRIPSMSYAMKMPEVKQAKRLKEKANKLLKTYTVEYERMLGTPNLFVPYKINADV